MKTRQNLQNCFTALSTALSMTVLSATGCLDLNLLDDMNPMDAGEISGNDGSGGAANQPLNDTEGSPPKPDANDTLPPTVTGLECGPAERREQETCVAEGSISASIRFSTDEPAVVSIDPSAAFVARMITDSWSTAHHTLASSLPDDEDTLLTLRIADVNGNETELTVSVRGGGGPAVAVTEVLADPLGAEPAQEFVEITNLGESPVDLSGWMVDDNDDANGDIIPDGTVLDGGQIALLVSAAFSAAGGEDGAPPAGTMMIHLDGSIGSNGLKNGEAESVVLFDAGGKAISSYDGSAGAPKEGISASRRFSEWPDGCPGGFIPDPSGASPGISPRLNETL